MTMVRLSMSRKGHTLSAWKTRWAIEDFNDKTGFASTQKLQTWTLKIITAWFKIIWSQRFSINVGPHSGHSEVQPWVHPHIAPFKWDVKERCTECKQHTHSWMTSAVLHSEHHGIQELYEGTVLTNLWHHNSPKQEWYHYKVVVPPTHSANPKSHCGWWYSKFTERSRRS